MGIADGAKRQWADKGAFAVEIFEVINRFLIFALFQQCQTGIQTGEFGRFGNQINSIHMLLELPFGFGPLQFGKIFGLDPHNVYINAFGSYGWLGGITYMLMIISTIIVGFRGLLIRTPWQGQSIALFCTFFATALQGNAASAAYAAQARNRYGRE